MVPFNLLVDAHQATFGKSFKETQKIQTIPLDDFAEWKKIKKINFIRMDVEGFEVEIVEGMNKVFKLMPANSYLTIEFHSILLKNRQPFVKAFDKIIRSGFSTICVIYFELVVIPPPPSVLSSIFPPLHLIIKNVIRWFPVSTLQADPFRAIFFILNNQITPTSGAGF